VTMINMILQVSEQLGAASVAGQELHRQVGQQEQSSVSTGIRSRNSRAEGGAGCPCWSSSSTNARCLASCSLWGQFHDLEWTKCKLSSHRTYGGHPGVPVSSVRKNIPARCWWAPMLCSDLVAFTLQFLGLDAREL
jgi:hypothetical protein